MNYGCAHSGGLRAVSNAPLLIPAQNSPPSTERLRRLFRILARQPTDSGLTEMRGEAAMRFAVKSKKRDAKICVTRYDDLPHALITGDQVRATRKLLGWSQDALAGFVVCGRRRINHRQFRGRA
jgi:hypothetical protein